MEGIERHRYLVPLLAAFALAVLFGASFGFWEPRIESPVTFAAAGARKVPPPPPAAVSRILPPLPPLTAHAYIVQIQGEERSIASQRPYKPMRPASITKLMTALLAYERVPKEELIHFSESAKNTEEKTSNVRTNEAVSRDDAIRLALIPSANDATLALAEHVGNNASSTVIFSEAVRTFVLLMNEKARDIGLTDSSFINPIGLDEEGHMMSARDVARLMEYIWDQHPDFFAISRAKDAVVISDEDRAYRIENTNILLSEYPAILGSKTGFTDLARGTLAMVYPVAPGQVAFVVILGSEDRFGDGRKLIQWLEESF